MPSPGGGASEMPKLTPEFSLAVACCRWPPSDARDSVIRDAAVAVTDWDCFVRLIRRQRVDGLVHAALLSAGIELPAPAARELSLHAQKNSLRSVLLEAESVRLQHALAASDIPSMILKGAAVAQLAYGKQDLKQARDIDILVAPAHAQASLRLLEGLGYERVSPAGPLNEMQHRVLFNYGKELELAHSINRLTVELQWRLSANPLLLKNIDADSPAQDVLLADGSHLRTLARDDNFAYLCVHGALHSWSRLKWLADLNAIIAGVDDAGIVRLYRHAQAKGAGLCAGQALLLRHRLFDWPLPPALRAEFAASARPEKLVALALTAMTAPRAPAGRDLSEVARNVRTPFLLGRGWNFYWTQCRLVSFGIADVIRMPLPRGLHFLYPLLRIPLWLWRRGKRARQTAIQTASKPSSG